MWIIFIAIGILLLLVGIYLLVFPESKKKEPVIPEPIKKNITETVQQNYSQEQLIEIKDQIDLAISDGHISTSEKEKIITKAKVSQIPLNDVDALLEQATINFQGRKEVKPIDPNKEAGDLFETFMGNKIKYSKFMDILQWQNDKNIGTGIHVIATKHPDLHVIWECGKLKAEFAIECKYRSRFYQGGFDLAERKYLDYQRYSQDQNMPVFIALGLGGKPENPENVFLAPLSLFANGKVTEQELSGYKMANPKGNLFYGYYDKTLRQTDKQKANG